MKKQICDERDGKRYAYVVIGNQTWMAENLNYEVEGSSCLSNLESNCERYGRLYNWAMAMVLPEECNEETDCTDTIKAPHQGICPSGWHIPYGEWAELLDYIDYSSSAIHLRTTEGWFGCNASNNCMDTFGFAASPSGAQHGSGNFFGTVGNYGYWWNATSSSGTNPYASCMSMDNNSLSVVYCAYFKVDSLSSRCIKD
jgi:uncharacterized protein (TIGR02145 family)